MRTAVVLSLLVSLASGLALAEAPADKIAPPLARALEREPSVRTEMLVLLEERADLSGVEAIAEKKQRGREVAARLAEVARRSQRPLLDELVRLGVPHRAYWIANFVWIEGDLAIARELVRRPDVARLAANPRLRAVEPPNPEAKVSLELAPSAIESNLEQVEAPALWQLGYTGQSAVVGGADTGVRWDHDALKRQYRGWTAGGVDHAYQWHDAIHSEGGSCGADAQAPCDPQGHGTHTMGTMVGDDGGANRVGVAPGARWIACRNMDYEGHGTPTTYAECLQWFLAPTDLADRNPRPDLAPDVINNSWGCTGAEGCGDIDILRSAVEAVRAAGIVVVSSAGNAGSLCATVSTPPAIYDAVFAVGAVGPSDAPSTYSSRGPVTVDGSNRMKPDAAAPGENVRSTWPFSANSYGFNSGTSMAAPHAAALVALLISVEPSLAGDVDAIEALLRDTASHPATSTQTCGGVSATSFPNNTFGAGRLDALAAASELLGASLIFSDGFESRGAARWSALAR